MEVILIVIGIIAIIAYAFHNNRTKKIEEYIKEIGGKFNSYNHFSLTSYGYNTFEKLKLNPFDKEKFFSVNYNDKNNKPRKLIVSFDFNENMKIHEDKPIVL